MFSREVQITKRREVVGRVCNAIAPDVKLSRRSTIERKIYDISHFPLNTKHRNTFWRRYVRVLEGYGKLVPGERWGIHLSEGRGVVYFLTLTRSRRVLVRRRLRITRHDLYHSDALIVGYRAIPSNVENKMFIYSYTTSTSLSIYLSISLSSLLFLPFPRFIFSQGVLPSRRYFRPAESRFHRLKPAHKTVAVFQRRKVLTFWLFDLQPLLEIQRAAMT